MRTKLADCNRRIVILPSTTDRAWLTLFDRNASLPSLPQHCQYHVYTEAGYRLRIFIPDDVPFSAADAGCENNMLVGLHFWGCSDPLPLPSFARFTTAIPSRIRCRQSAINPHRCASSTRASRRHVSSPHLRVYPPTPSHFPVTRSMWAR